MEHRQAWLAVEGGCGGDGGGGWGWLGTPALDNVQQVFQKPPNGVTQLDLPVTHSCFLDAFQTLTV